MSLGSVGSTAQEPDVSSTPDPPAPADYRPDIQGLRGIAVLLVVVFHTTATLPGGFVGVDVFFVISGFVIAGVLTRELDATGRISFPQFYSRRARRLLPALAAMSTLTLLMSVAILSPDGTQQAAAKTGAAASLSIANLQLYLGGDQYFATSADLNPFLHTWSLSVEEQFYLVLPALVAGVGWIAARRRFGRPDVVLGAAVFVGSAASLALSIALTAGLGPMQDPTKFSFYSPLTRAWEFGVGVLIALLGTRFRAGPRWGVAMAAGGAVGLAAAAVFFGEGTPFPGYWAALPVFSTSLLILGGQFSSRVGRVVGWRPLVSVGDLAYSWYLWHWPLIVFARFTWPRSAGVLVAAAVLALVPAMLSFAWVEQPLRRRTSFTGVRALQVGRRVCRSAAGAHVGRELVRQPHRLGDVRCARRPTSLGLPEPGEFSRMVGGRLLLPRR